MHHNFFYGLESDLLTLPGQLGQARLIKLISPAFEITANAGIGLRCAAQRKCV
jgi:hypothetical protein